MSCFQAEEFTKEDRMLLFETENFKEAFKQMDRNEDDKVVSRKYSPHCLQVFFNLSHEMVERYRKLYINPQNQSASFAKTIDEKILESLSIFYCARYSFVVDCQFI